MGQVRLNAQRVHSLGADETFKSLKLKKRKANHHTQTHTRDVSKVRVFVKPQMKENVSRLSGRETRGPVTREKREASGLASGAARQYSRIFLEVQEGDGVAEAGEGVVRDEGDVVDAQVKVPQAVQPAERVAGDLVELVVAEAQVLQVLCNTGAGLKGRAVPVASVNIFSPCLCSSLLFVAARAMPMHHERGHACMHASSLPRPRPGPSRPRPSVHPARAAHATLLPGRLTFEPGKGLGIHVADLVVLQLQRVEELQVREHAGGDRVDPVVLQIEGV